MKTILLLLLASIAGFNCLAQATNPAAAKPKVKMISNSNLLGLMTKELTVTHLRKVYGTALRVSKVSRNIHDPAIQDTLLAVNTTADKFQLLSNRYNAFLLKADFTSQKLAFGKGIRIGATKAVFCKVVNLPTSFDGYQIADAEGGSNIYFLFRQGVLAKVTYDIGWLD